MGSHVFEDDFYEMVTFQVECVSVDATKTNDKSSKDGAQQTEPIKSQRVANMSSNANQR